MDLFVELPDGTSKHVPVSLSCSVRAATQSCVLRAGMASVASKLTEFSLAKKTDNPNPLIDVEWLDEGLRVKDQGGDSGSLNLILLKKYYTSNSDLSLISSNTALLRNIYSQFRRTYVSGLYRCTQSEAAQLSALIARAEFSLSELRPGSLKKTGRLVSIVPQHHLHSKNIEQDILKALSSVATLSETRAQEQFISLVSKLDTFGLSIHTIMLVEIGGERREALFGVGNKTISVMECQSLKTLMHWKTRDLTEHSFNETTFTMKCNSDSITMVTKQGHMISTFLSGMNSSGSSRSPVKKPLSHHKSVGFLENGQRDSEIGEGLADRTSSTHIKSIGQHLERYEVNAKKSAPSSPSSRRPRPVRPPGPKPRHAPLRGTKSVPNYNGDSKLPTVPQSPPISEDKPGAVYEVPLLPGGGAGAGAGGGGRGGGGGGGAGAGGGDEKKANPPEEILYSPTTFEEKGSQSVGIKSRNVLPPPPRGKKPPLKVKPLPPIIPPHLLPDSDKNSSSSSSSSSRKPRKLDTKESSDKELPVYHELHSPEYAEPETPVTPSPKPPPRTRSQLPPTPFSPPAPTSPAPPPPPPSSSSAEGKVQSPLPPPKTPAPEPPVYDTLTPEEDMKEIEDVFGSKDLPEKVKYSCDTNPIYDTLAANRLSTSITSSNVTYHSFKKSLERQKKQNNKVLPKVRSQPQFGASPTPTSSSSSSSPSSPPLPYSPKDYENSELLSLLSKDISSPTTSSPTPDHKPPSINEPRKEKPRKKTPSPPLKRGRSEGQLLIEEASSSLGEKKPPLPAKPTPSYGYSRLDHFSNKKPAAPPVEPVKNDTTSGDSDPEGHEYAEVDYNLPRKTKLNQKKRNEAGWMVVQNGESTPPPIPPLRGMEWEGKKLGPPKPPRIRQRWDKKVAKEGKSHKAVKHIDALRDYSSLMQDFRMFHIKMPTGVMHTDMGNIRAEVGKLVKRLCVLLCVNEVDFDHFSLYVEGTPHTVLPEVEEEDGGGGGGGGGGEEGGMLKRLKQKSPSRQDLSSSRFFVALSERSSNPILLDPTLSFKAQGITTTRILALRPQTILTGKIIRFQIRIPDWVRFHQCWLSVVQGNVATTQSEAIKLAALQYQAYFRDRTELNSVIGFCRSSDFLPLNYANVKGIEEKVYAEQQKLKDYTRTQAQDRYITTSTSVPTYNTIFFLCQEAKRKLLRIKMKHTQLAPVMIGMSKDGVIRADYKSKEVLDVWPYKVLKNWGYTENTFILEFDNRTYPVKTSQGRWMNAMVDFHIESILGDLTLPPVTHQEMGGATRGDDMDPIPHNREDVDDIYSDLLSVRAQAQQWMANGKGSSTSSSPPSSPPDPHLLQPPPLTPLTNEPASPFPIEPADYEEVDFNRSSSASSSTHRVGPSSSTYDVLRKDWGNEDDDAIYEIPENNS